MNLSAFTILGLLGGLIALSSNVPYVRDIIRGSTKPHRVTWGIFFLLNVIFLANQLASGAKSSIWLVVAFVISTLIIFSLSLKFGVGGTTKLDILVLTGALVGIVVWQLLGSPLASVIANLIVATIASIPTYKKSWTDPLTETNISYLLGTIAAACTIGSIGKIDLALMLLPVYSFLYNGSVYLILNRKSLFSNTSSIRA